MRRTHKHRHGHRHNHSQMLATGRCCPKAVGQSEHLGPRISDTNSFPSRVTPRLPLPRHTSPRLAGCLPPGRWAEALWRPDGAAHTTLASRLTSTQARCRPALALRATPCAPDATGRTGTAACGCVHRHASSSTLHASSSTLPGCLSVSAGIGTSPAVSAKWGVFHTEPLHPFRVTPPFTREMAIFEEQ